MDATHYDKIADKLIQFRSKIPHESDISMRDAKCAVMELKKSIDNLLWQIDNYSLRDEKGWIK